MGNPAANFIGKVPAIYAISLMLVFLTWIFAKIVGADGRDLFNAAFALTAVELIVPLAVIIVVVCLGSNIIMPIALPYLEFLIGLLIAAASGAGSIFNFELTLTNPFTDVTWIELDPDIYVNQLLAIMDSIHDWMIYGAGETAAAAGEVVLKVIQTILT